MRDNSKRILYTGAAIIGLFALYKIAQKFGVFKDVKDFQEDENEQVEQTVGNAWDRNYWHQFNWSMAKQNAVHSIAKPAAKILRYDVFGIFNDDFNMAFAQIKKFKTKAEISFLVDTFAYEFEGDLFNWLKDGRDLVPASGLSVSNLNTIVNYVNSLPNF